MSTETTFTISKEDIPKVLLTFIEENPFFEIKNEESGDIYTNHYNADLMKGLHHARSEWMGKGFVQHTGVFKIMREIDGEEKQKNVSGQVLAHVTQAMCSSYLSLHMKLVKMGWNETDRVVVKHEGEEGDK